LSTLFCAEPLADPADDEEPSSEANQNSDCDLQDCLELYQAAQDSMQARHDGSSSARHHTGSVAADSRSARCTILRTFFLCIRNMSKSCLGDLTFHSSHRVVQKQMRDFNCSQRGPVYRPPIAIPPLTGGFSSPSEGDLPCSYRKDVGHQFCTVFGDPHLRTFDGTHQTCRVIGAFPMLDNEYLSIQVTSEAINNAGASAIAKVSFCSVVCLTSALCF
jgi:RGM domain family member B